MAARSPEIHNRGADGRVVLMGMRVDVAGVGDLALRGGVDAVDLGGGEGAQDGEAEGLGEGVDARVLEQLVAGLVDVGRRGVGLEISRARDLPREVVPRVQELEETPDGVEVLVDEVDAPVLGRG
jgi:hypothetical protein